FGVILIPGLYYAFASLSDHLRKRGRKEEKPFTEEI
ncbi:MAG: hypothetical protein RL151_152, partial [Bacteroidota bacterium]